MKKFSLGAATVLSIASLAPVLNAQEAETPAVIQTQANPVGEGAPSPAPPDPATADSPVPPAMPADPDYHAGPYAGALTPPPGEAFNKDYPVCSKTVQDSCINPGGK